MANSPKFERVSTKQQQIAQLARNVRNGPIKSLNHYLDEEWLMAAFYRTNPKASPGIDDISADAFEMELGTNVRILLDQAKSGEYQAPPVKRAWIPKSETEKRPIGLPTVADKVLQRGVTMILEEVYEQEFLDISYGFRPSRNCHQAVDKIRAEMMAMGVGGVIIEADIRKFFDELSHSHLRTFLRERIGDGVILKLIDKWLKAGVMSDGTVQYSETGSVQGGVISPILANLYLHHVLDRWFEEEVKPRLNSRCFLARYCDDFVMGFVSQGDAERVLAALTKRFTKFGLRLHEEKTRIVPFNRPRPKQTKPDKAKTDTFDFLGFTFYWGLSRWNAWTIKRKTASDRFMRGLKRMNDWIKRNRHIPARDLIKIVWMKVVGHANYYGLPGNAGAVYKFQYHAILMLKKWLSRRTNNGTFTIERLRALVKRYPRPKMHTQFCDAGLPNLAKS